jgi:phospholipid-transporting ATPase
LSPKQKAELVQLIRVYKPDQITLAIGDGANDVSMIIKANIGVGICGKEGNQAVSSSDYALTEFKDLKTLIFYHGREAYRRNGYLVYYMLYKNLLQNIPIVLFGFYSGFSGQIFYETIFT